MSRLGIVTAIAFALLAVTGCFVLQRRRARRPPSRPSHIVVVGGGYVGMYTALRLQRKLHRSEATVTVSSRDPP